MEAFTAGKIPQGLGNQNNDTKIFLDVFSETIFKHF